MAVINGLMHGIVLHDIMFNNFKVIFNVIKYY